MVLEDGCYDVFVRRCRVRSVVLLSRHWFGRRWNTGYRRLTETLQPCPLMAALEHKTRALLLAKRTISSREHNVACRMLGVPRQAELARLDRMSGSAGRELPARFGREVQCDTVADQS